MMLSMRMILNRLEDLAIYSFVNDDEDPADLMSARMAYAPNCLQVSSLGRNVLCQSTPTNRFLIEDISLQEGFEIIQGIFDYYNDWEANAFRLSVSKKFQELVDSCHPIFHNPIILFDGNNRVLAISSAYGESDAGEEWRYLKKNGFSSVEMVNHLKHFGQLVDHSIMGMPQILSPSSERLTKRIANVKLYWNNEFCGRMVVLEKDRPLNSGDLQVMDHLQNIISPYLAQEDSSASQTYFKDVFSEIITTGKVDSILLEKQISYLHWDDAREFRLFLVKLSPYYSSDVVLHQLRRTLLKIFPFSSVNIIEECLAVIVRAEALVTNPVDLLIDELSLQEKASVGVSLPFHDLTKLHHYFRQTLYAVSSAPGSEEGRSVRYAFDTIIPYLLCCCGQDGILYACHPDILKLMELDKDGTGGYLALLKAYLDNERNISGTAKALYMHRNTLVYRLEKLASLLTADLENPYERDYLKLSLYIVETLHRNPCPPSFEAK